MYGCHKYNNYIPSQLHAVDGNNVFDDGVLMMDVACDL
jgi:hypothetical protein